MVSSLRWVVKMILVQIRSPSCFLLNNKVTWDKEVEYSTVAYLFFVYVERERWGPMRRGGVCVSVCVTQTFEDLGGLVYKRMHLCDVYRMCSLWNIFYRVFSVEHIL
jgi:hypothetical protein